MPDKNVPDLKKIIRPHGAVRGLAYVARSSTDGSRFGRMFRWLPGETYDKEDLKKLAGLMIQKDFVKIDDPTSKEVDDGPSVSIKPDASQPVDTKFGEAEPGDENPTIPAGYTYFGQFIDHDLTFDPNSSLQKLNDPDATENFRTPRLDLDNLYGRGPDDQPYLYDDRDLAIKFILATDRPGELERNVNGRAIIGDPRNDENHIVAQLQAIFLNFHNKVIDQLGKDRKDLDTQPHAKFQLAQRIVRWHYQYLVVNDYLPKILGKDTLTKVLGNNPATDPKPDLKFYKPKGGQAYIPVEFSVAAFRFGHSMVRPSYALNQNIGGSETTKLFGSGRFSRVPIFDGTVTPGQSLDGFQPLPDKWEIDWNLFFSDKAMPVSVFEKAGNVDNNKWQLDFKKDPKFPTQPSYRIDTALVDPLAMLPVNVAKSGDQPDHIPSLAFRNLLRGSQFQLPSGQNVARALGEPVLGDEELWKDSETQKVDEGLKSTFAFNAPLWYYLLKESEIKTTGPAGAPGLPPNPDAAGGHHLGPVGGRIVGEVIVGVLWNDHTSYLYQDRTWTPAAEKDKSGFKPGPTLDSIHALIKWVTDGRMSL